MGTLSFTLERFNRVIISSSKYGQNSERKKASDLQGKMSKKLDIQLSILSTLQALNF